MIAEGQPCWTPTARFTEPAAKVETTRVWWLYDFWVTIHAFFGWQYMAPILKRQNFWCAGSMLTPDSARYCKAFQDISNIEMLHLIAINTLHIYFHYAQNRVCNGPDGNFLRTLVLSDLPTTECRPLQHLSCHHPTNNNWNMYIMYSPLARTEQPLTRSQLIYKL